MLDSEEASIRKDRFTLAARHILLTLDQKHYARMGKEQAQYEYMLAGAALTMCIILGLSLFGDIVEDEDRDGRSLRPPL